MPVIKIKSPVRRIRKAINSPEPEGPVGGMGMDEDPTCGHSSCGRSCGVRHVGPTSSIRDHHIAHIARGVSSVWTASIVAGLAVVLTGAIAYSAVQASPVQREAASGPSMTVGFNRLNDQFKALNKRLDDLEIRLKVLNDSCTVSSNGASAADSAAVN